MCKKSVIGIESPLHIASSVVHAIVGDLPDRLAGLIWFFSSRWISCCETPAFLAKVCIELLPRKALSRVAFGLSQWILAIKSVVSVINKFVLILRFLFIICYHRWYQIKNKMFKLTALMPTAMLRAIYNSSLAELVKRGDVVSPCPDHTTITEYGVYQIKLFSHNRAD